MRLGGSIIDAIVAHAEREFPRESCGLLLGDEDTLDYRAHANSSATPQTHFRIAQQHIKVAADRLCGIVHSHPAPAPPCPSAADMRQQIAFGVPWVIVPVGPGGDAGVPFCFGDGVPIPDLVGRGYRHGVTDCYAVIRDWYRVQRNLILDDVPRHWRWWEDSPHPDLYERGFAAAGFSEIPRAEADVGDAVLIAFGARGVVSHAAVIVAPGVMLHHPSSTQPYDPARLSRREPLARWREHIRRVLRHPGAQR